MYRAARAPSPDADLVYRQSAVLVLRLLVVELARAGGRLPARVPPVTVDSTWSQIAGCFDLLHHGLGDELADRASPHRGLFSPEGLGGENAFLDLYRPSDGTVRCAVDVALSAARRTASPHQVLTGAYESLLRFAPRVDLSTGSYRLERCARRKVFGAFYTPPAVARLLAEATLRLLPVRDGPGDGWPPRVMDPAMGTGVFLLEAARLVARRSRWDAATVAERCLHGVDLDPLAVEIAVLALWLETGARPAILARHFQCGDALGAEGVPPPYDAVLSNPPWGAGYAGEERQRLIRRFPRSTRSSFDSFKLFLDLGASWTQGTLGMLVPQAVLAQAACADVREVLLERLAPYCALDLGNGHFSGTAAPACGLVWGPKPGPELVQCVDARPTQRHAPVAAVPRARWAARTGFPLIGMGALDLLERLQGRHPLLRDLPDRYRVRDVGINYSCAALARRVLYQGPEPEDRRDIPRYRGRNFGRYTGIEVGGWLRHDAESMVGRGEKLSLDWGVYRRAEKVVFRQTADRLTATLDRTGMALGRSVIAIVGEGDAALLPLLACLNSRLLTVLYRALSGEAGRVLPQVKVGRMAALPVPSVCLAPASGPLRDLARSWRAHHEDALLRHARDDPRFAWAWLEQLAAELLAADGRDNHMDALADRVVCGLYGTTESEVGLLELEVAAHSHRTSKSVH